MALYLIALIVNQDVNNSITSSQFDSIITLCYITRSFCNNSRLW